MESRIEQGQLRRELEHARALVAMSRELLQSDDAAAVLRLAGAAISELTQAGAALLMLRGPDGAVAFDRAGRPLAAGPDHAWFAMAAQLLGQETGSAPAAVSDTALRRMLAVTAPPLDRPMAALVAGWDAELSKTARREHRRALDTILELATAALGKIEERGTLAQRVSVQDEQIASSVEAHASELARRDAIERDMRMLSLTDVLTGLNNRRGFFVQGEQAFKLAQRSHGRSAVIYADIDGLKLVNDSLGHDAGDALIRDAATVFRASFRDADVVARLGGDEFVAYTLDDAQPQAILDRIQDNLQAFNLMQERPYDIAISAGVVACNPGGDAGLFDYVEQADRHMVDQKRRRLH